MKAESQTDIEYRLSKLQNDYTTAIKKKEIAS